MKLKSYILCSYKCCSFNEFYVPEKIIFVYIGGLFPELSYDKKFCLAH